jgi:PKD repeat protein
MTIVLHSDSVKIFFRFAAMLLFIFSTQSAYSQVTGSDSVCTGDLVTYSVPSVSGASYSWSVTGDVYTSPLNAATASILWGPAGTGTIVVTVNLPSSTQVFHTLTVNIYPKPTPAITHPPYPGCSSHGGQGGAGIPDRKDECEKVCKFATVTYATPLNAGSSYFWVITGASSFTGQFTNSVTVNWDGTLVGTLIVYETNQWGCVDSATWCVEKVDLPVAAFTHQASVCKNTPVNFQNLSTGATSYQWFFGDGGTSTSGAPVVSHSYTTAGTYTITLIATNDCNCSDTATSIITVDSLPGPDIFCPSTICAFDTATYSTGASGCTYNWFVTGGNIVGANNLQSVTVAWGAGQMGTLGLVVSGCVGVCSDTTLIYIPIVPVTATISGPAKVCPGSCETYYLPKFSGASYTWSLTGGCGMITGDTTCCETVEICWPSNPFLNCNDTLTVNYWDAFLGCGGSAQYIIRARPELSIFGDQLACANGTSNYSAFGGVPCFWSISPAGPVITPGPSPTATVNWNGFTGNFIIAAVPVNPNQVCNDTVFVLVKVVPPPATPVITGDTVVCPNSFHNYCATGSGVINWFITGGTPSNPTGNCITVNWGTTPPFIVQAIQQMPNSPYCNSDTATQNIYPVLSPAAPNISGLLIACANSTSNLFTTTLYPAGTTYTWTLSPPNAGAIVSGQGTSSINIEWGNNAPQNVTVTLTVDVCGQTVQNSVTVSLNPAPLVTVTQIGILCPGGSVQLQASGGVSYLWSTGSTANPITVFTAGLYSVTAVDANGCTAHQPHTVTAVSGPVASISTADFLTYCLGSSFTVNMCALGNPGYTYSWSNSATTQCISVSVAGSYNVTITDANGCTAASNTLTVSQITCGGGGGNCTPDPTASVSFTHSGCNPVSFTNTSVNAFNYSWNFGDGNFSGATNPTHTYASAGFYLVTLSADVTNTTPPPTECTLTDTAHIEIPLAAKFDFVTGCSYAPVCFTDQSTFTAGNNITSWNWNFGDANTSVLQNPCHTYTTPGTYTVTLTIGNGTCTHTYTQNVTVPAKPTAAFTFSSPNCVNVPVTFTDASFSLINYWNWDFGDAGTSLNQNPSHSYAAPASYPVTLIVRDIYGCYDTVQQNVTINVSALTGNITAYPDTVVCAGTDVILVAPVCAGCTYLWNNGSTNDSITVTATGIYSVTMSDASGCPYSTFIKIIVHNAPNAQIQGKTKLCMGSFTSLSVTNNINWTYNWLSNDLGVNGQTFNSVFAAPSLPGVYNYQVVITDTSTGCSDTTLVHLLTVYNIPVPPVISSLGASTVCQGDTVILVGSHPDTTVTFSWNTGAITDTLIVTKNGCYTLEVTDTNGCTNNNTFCATVNPLPYLCSFYEGCFDTCAPYTILGPVGGATYQWVLNGNILPGDTSQNLTTSVSGLYSVIVTNSYGCTDTTGVLDLTLYPCDSLCAEFIIDSIYCDSTGKYVMLYHVINHSPDTIDEIGLQILPPHLSVAYAPNLIIGSLPPGSSSPPLSATIYNGNAGDTLCFQSFLYINHDSTGQGLCCKKLCCKSDTLCVVLPPCDIDSNCCYFTYLWDTVRCLQNPVNNMNEYHFTMQVDGCGFLEIQTPSNVNLNWINPTFITGGITTITGIYTPPAGTQTMCLTFMMRDSMQQYCADTTICIDLPPCDKPIDSTCLISSADSICVGQSATFLYTGNVNASTYTWQFPFGTPNTATGIGPHTVTYNTPGCHSVVLILNDNMPGTIDCVDSICVYPPPVATITQVGNSLQAGPAGMNYQWFEQNPNWTILSGETNQFLNPQYSTLFCVEVTNAEGCKDTACIDHQWMSVAEFDNDSWSVFPNPNDGTFTLKFNAVKNETVEMKVFNTLGTVIDQRSFEVKPGEQQFYISNEKFASGIYFIQLKSGVGMGLKKFVVK